MVIQRVRYEVAAQIVTLVTPEIPERAQTASLGKKTETELVIFLPVYSLFLDQSSRKDGRLFNVWLKNTAK